MRSKMLVMTVTCLAVLSLFIPSCAPDVASPSKLETPAAKPPSTPAAATPTPKLAAEQPRYGGVLTFAQDAEPASFDVHQEAGGQHPLFLTSCYNGLLQHDPLAWPEAKIIPDLASSWEVSPDGLEYAFRLKSGVKWHDGKPFTSEDVKASLDRIFKPPKGMLSPRQGSFPAIAEVQAIAPDVVRIRLRYRSASLLSNLAMDWLAVLPQHIIEAKGDMKRDILGTGPFKFKGYSPGSSYDYVKNSEYFVKGRPYLDGIKAYIVKDAVTRFAALRTGRVLYLPYPRGLAPAQAEVAKSEPRLVVQSNWRPTIYHLRPNLQTSPWSDPRVRRAVSLALDRQAFILTVLQGAGVLGTHMPSRGTWGIPEDELLKMPGYRQPKDADIAEANRLLAEAGFPEGFKTSVITRSEEIYEKEGTFILAELAKLGIKGELLMTVTAAFMDALVRGAFDLEGYATSTALDDPDLMFGDNHVTGAGRNYGKYSNRKFDELYEKQSQALDITERKKLVREMQMILLQDNPTVPLAWGISFIAHNSRVRNYKLGSSPYVNNRHQEAWLAD